MRSRRGQGQQLPKGTGSTAATPSGIAKAWRTCSGKSSSGGGAQACAGAANGDVLWLREYLHVHYLDSARCRFARAKDIGGHEDDAVVRVHAFSYGGVQHGRAELLHSCANRRVPKTSHLPPWPPPEPVGCVPMPLSIALELYIGVLIWICRHTAAASALGK